MNVKHVKKQKDGDVKYNNNGVILLAAGIGIVVSLLNYITKRDK